MNGITAFTLGLFFVVGLATYPVITLAALAVGFVFWVKA